MNITRVTLLVSFYTVIWCWKVYFTTRYCFFIGPMHGPIDSFPLTCDSVNLFVDRIWASWGRVFLCYKIKWLPISWERDSTIGIRISSQFLSAVEMHSFRTSGLRLPSIICHSRYRKHLCFKNCIFTSFDVTWYYVNLSWDLVSQKNILIRVSIDIGCYLC